MQVILDTTKPIDQDTLAIISNSLDDSDVSGVMFSTEDRKGVSKQELDDHLTLQGLMYIHFHSQGA
jgi:hypothetical protein